MRRERSVPNPRFVSLDNALHVPLLLGALLALMGAASAFGQVNITEATWIDEDGISNDRLEVRGTSTTGQTVLIGEPDGRTKLGQAVYTGGDEWLFQDYNPLAVPCSVVAFSAGARDQRVVAQAPPNCGPPPDQAPLCRIRPLPGPVQVDVPVVLTAGARDPEGKPLTYSWHFGGGADETLSGEVASNTPFETVITFDEGGQAFTLQLTVTDAAGQPGLCSTKILVGEAPIASRPPVPEQPFPGDPRSQDVAVLAFNDLGMHCADLGSKPFSILPPFNVLNSQAVERGFRPRLLGDTEVEMVYSAASNPSDPVVFDSGNEPPSINSTAQNDPPGSIAEEAVIRKTDFWDPVDPTDPESLTVVKTLFDQDPPPDEGLATISDVDGFGRRMPGIGDPYFVNDPQPFSTFQQEFGWFKAEGIPITNVDDYGRQNSYPLMRVQARSKVTGQVLAAIDAVVPVSTEVDCRDCHGKGAVGADPDARVDDLGFMDPVLPGDRVSEEFAAKTNALLLHDFKHQFDDGGIAVYDPPLAERGAVLCAGCHNSFALEEVTGGALAGDPTLPKMSEAMHGFHGLLKVALDTGELLRDGDGEPISGVDLGPNEGRLLPVDPLDPKVRMESNCFTCHPGKITQCFRGAMFAAGMKCSNCHGDMLAMGGVFEADFDRTGNPADLRTRLPWRDEPRCESCHRGDAVVPGKDEMLAELAFDLEDPAAVPILSPNGRFAENRSIDPDTGKAVLDLYRNSLDAHGGPNRDSAIACEACHGSPHAIWGNPLAPANDNVTAHQLQGYAGKVMECSVCHTQGSFPNGTLDGPHGMHPVNDPNWIKSDGGWHGQFAENNAGGDPCAACHGVDHLGTRLAVTPIDRELRDSEGRLRATVTAGQQIACNLCHSLDDSFPD